MLLKTMERAGCSQVYMAGFDGFQDKIKLYYSDDYSHEEGKNVSLTKVKHILDTTLSELTIHFLTPSSYE